MGINTKSNRLDIRYMARVAILASISVLLFTYLVPPIPLFAPWLTIDFSDIPALIAGFAMGPLAGVLVELFKLLKVVLKPEFSSPVGEFASVLVGCAFIIPAALIYRAKKSLRTAIIGLIVGFVCFVFLAAILNWLVLIPVFAILISGKPLSILFTNSPSEVYNLIAGGQEGIFAGAVSQGYSAIKDLSSYIFLACIPFNVVKGVLISLVTALLYKRLSPLLHN